MSEENKGGSPDLSRIVNLIMENPKLIEEISALAKGGSEEASTLPEKAEEAVPEKTAEAVAANTYEHTARPASRERRNQLLCALKPYISEERQKAVDSMMTFAEILDTMRGR